MFGKYLYIVFLALSLSFLSNLCAGRGSARWRKSVEEQDEKMIELGLKNFAGACKKCVSEKVLDQCYTEYLKDFGAFIFSGPGEERKVKACLFRISNNHRKALRNQEANAQQSWAAAWVKLHESWLCVKESTGDACCCICYDNYVDVGEARQGALFCCRAKQFVCKTCFFQILRTFDCDTSTNDANLFCPCCRNLIFQGPLTTKEMEVQLALAKQHGAES